MIGKLTRTIVRTFAFALALCTTSGAWAAEPVAVWDGNGSAEQNFSILTRTNNDITYTLNKNDNNNIISDTYIQVAQANQLKAFTITANDGATNPFGTGQLTVIIKCSNMQVDYDTSNRALITLCDGDTSKIGIYEKGTSGGFIDAGATYGAGGIQANVYSTGEQTIAMTYQSNANGTGYYVNGVLVAQAGSLRYSGFTNPSKITIGGLAVAGSTALYEMRQMKIHAIAIFTSRLSAQEVGSYVFPSDVPNSNDSDYYHATITEDTAWNDIAWDGGKRWSDSSAASTVCLDVASGKKVTVSGDITAKSIYLTNGTLESTGTVTVNAEIMGASALSVSSGTLTLSGCYRASGNTTVSSGAKLSLAYTGYFNSAVSGAGNVEVSYGTINLGVTSNLTGTFTVKNGAKARACASNAFRNAATSGAPNVIVESGGVIDFNGTVQQCIYEIAGDGDGDGALINTGAEIGTNLAQCPAILLKGNASIGGTGNWSLLNSNYDASYLGFRNASYTLTKKGSNTINFVNTERFGSSVADGNLKVESGTLYFWNTSKTIRLSAVALTVENGATVGGQCDVTLKSITIKSGATLSTPSNKTWTMSSGYDCYGTLTINNATTSPVNVRSGGVLNANADITGTVTGSGKVVCPTGTFPSVAGLNAAGWTGKVVVPAFTASTETSIAFNNLGNANSTVVLNGVGASNWAKIYPAGYPTTVNPTVEIAGPVNFTYAAPYEATHFSRVTGNADLWFNTATASSSYLWQIDTLTNFTGRIGALIDIYSVNHKLSIGTLALSAGTEPTTSDCLVKMDNSNSYGRWTNIVNIASTAVTIGGAATEYRLIAKNLEVGAENPGLYIAPATIKLKNGTITPYESVSAALTAAAGMLLYNYDYVTVYESATVEFAGAGLKMKTVGEGVVVNLTVPAEYGDLAWIGGTPDENGVVLYDAGPTPTVYTWGGGASGSWTTATNWKYGESSASAHRTPDNGDDLIFNSDAEIAVSGEREVASITNSASITLTASSAASITATTGGIILSAAGASITVDGVTLSSAPTTSVSDKCVKWVVADGTTTYTVATPVAQIGDVKYGSIANAIEMAAASGDTIILIGDTAETATLNGKSITLEIADGVSFTGNFAGNGTIIELEDLGDSIVASTWTGTIRFAGEDELAGIPFLNTKLGGTVEIAQPIEDGAGGYFMLDKNIVFDYSGEISLSRFATGNKNTGADSAVQTFTQRNGTINVNGDSGPSNTGATLLLGHWPSTTTINSNGGVFNGPTTVSGVFGWNGSVTWNIGDGESAVDTATVNLYGLKSLIVEGGSVHTGAGILNLNVGGTLNLGAGGLGFSYSTYTYTTLNLKGGKLVTTAATAINSSGATVLDSGKTTTLQTDYDLAITGVISGSGNLAKTGSGKLTLNSANTATGTLTVSAGTLEFGANGKWSGNLTVSSGSLKLPASSEPFIKVCDGDLTLGDGVSVTIGETTYDTPIVENGYLLNGNQAVWHAAENATEGDLYDLARWTGIESLDELTMEKDVMFVLSDGQTVNVNANVTVGKIFVSGTGTVTVKSENALVAYSGLSLSPGLTLTVDGAGFAIQGTVTGGVALNVASTGEVAFSGLTCSVPIVNNGTINTYSGVSLSEANTFNYGSTLSVESGSTTLNAAEKGLKGKIVIKSGATLVNNRGSDALNYSATASEPAEVEVSGTLSMGSTRWTISSYPQNKIILHGTAQVTGGGDGNGALDWMENAYGMINADGTPTISAKLRMRSGAIVTNDVSSGTLTLSGGSVGGSKDIGQLVKSGAGILKVTVGTAYTGATTVSEGQMVYDRIFPTNTLVTIERGATFTLNSVAWTGNPTQFSGYGTLEFYHESTTYTDHKIHTVTGVTFPGTLRFTAPRDAGSNNRPGHIIKNTGFFASGVRPQLDVATFGNMSYNKLYLDPNFNNGTLAIRDLTGSGKLTALFASGTARNQTIETKQTTDSVFSGNIEGDLKNTADHINNLTVIGDGSETLHSLTLSGANSSPGTLTVSAYTKVAFADAGSWASGAVTVASDGWLESSSSATSVAGSLTIASGGGIVYAGEPIKTSGYATLAGTINIDATAVPKDSARVQIIKSTSGILTPATTFNVTGVTGVWETIVVEDGGSHILYLAKPGTIFSVY